MHYHIRHKSVLVLGLVLVAVVTACGGAEPETTPVPVATDIPAPTPTEVAIQKEPTPVPTLTEVPPTSTTNEPQCKDIFPEAKEVPAREYILILGNASHEVSEISTYWYISPSGRSDIHVQPLTSRLRSPAIFGDLKV